MATCEHGHTAPDATLNGLHASQAGPGLQRHKCTECAYEEGFQRGHQPGAAQGGKAECKQTGLSAPEEVIKNLPESQAGPGRHKCAICAYDAGFRLGREISGSKA